MSDFWIYFKLGLNHVLDFNGYDHVLFLIVLTVAYLFKDWKRVFWIVTIFTIGHTISLLLSTYNVIAVRANTAELLVYVTIIATALYNIFTAGKSNNKTKIVILLVVALFFGLIHGLAFSNYFKTITSGVESKLLPMLEFALGIEAAQIIVVLVVLVLSFVFQTVFRFSKRDWVMVISSIVLGIAFHIVDINFL
ncbi:HupE/UreJ protein [Kordia periserrulae]|uniref:HupE/UreJ protein n=1 Tax=Kordia periserrulae TaxID=701523 RepID=A0A2T6C774_9FLAO|nr:HupE/UreJ family protein [Kordia periserrulae]PTX64164.1 HupE/UreJ protein [Kordia periserrulae]